MAYLYEDDKQLNNGQPVNQNQTQSSAPMTSSAGSASVEAGQPVSQAGVGKGGTGGWTNIQSYIKANEGNQQASSNLLNNKVGTTFNSEASRLADESNKAKQEAASKVSNNTYSVDQAKANVNNLASQYNYKAPQADSYNEGVNKLKAARAYQYDGPTSYNFGLNAQAQNYGTGLKNDSGFSEVMNTLYGEAAGGQLGKGQKTLQTQLDVVNPYLSETRNNLNTQYSDLNNNINKTVEDTTKEVSSNAEKAKTNTSDLNNYLNTQSAADKNAIAQSALNHRIGEMYLTGQGMAQAGYLAKQGFDPNQPGYYNYNSGNKATLENALGVDNERNRWNAITDIFGGSDKINKSDVGPSFGTLTQTINGNRVLADGNRLYDNPWDSSDQRSKDQYSKIMDDLSSGNISDYTKQWLDSVKSNDYIMSDKYINDPSKKDQIQDHYNKYRFTDGNVRADIKNDKSGYWQSVLASLGLN